MAALTIIFVSRTLGSEFSKFRADCFGFAINITTHLCAFHAACTWEDVNSYRSDPLDLTVGRKSSLF
jgi:hypothetical protein